MDDVEQRIRRLTEFKEKLFEWSKRRDDNDLRAWLEQHKSDVGREVLGTVGLQRVTIPPPPGSIDDPSHPRFKVDPFQHIFDQRMIGHICSMIDNTVQTLQKRYQSVATKPFAFVAMPMDENNHDLEDVLVAIKRAADKCGINAERIDDAESNERITKRLVESIHKADFVIADMTLDRPNVFWEAGYAEAIDKTPIYIAKYGTTIHFDVKDYPVIIFKNNRELEEKLERRLRALLAK